MAQLSALDPAHPYQDQLASKVGPIVSTNTFNVPESQMDAAVKVWRQTAIYARLCRGYLSTQLRRGVAGSNFLINYAVWESAEAKREVFALGRVQGYGTRFPGRD